MYILRQYGSHPAFYLYQGKGLFYIYDSYQIPSEQWREKLSNQQTDRLVYFVGLILKSKDCQQLVSSGFDAAYSYFAANGFTEASTSIDGHRLSMNANQYLSFQVLDPVISILTFDHGMVKQLEREMMVIIIKRCFKICLKITK